MKAQSRKEIVGKNTTKKEDNSRKKVMKKIMKKLTTSVDPYPPSPSVALVPGLIPVEIQLPGAKEKFSKREMEHIFSNMLGIPKGRFGGLCRSSLGGPWSGLVEKNTLEKVFQADSTNGLVRLREWDSSAYPKNLSRLVRMLTITAYSEEKMNQELRKLAYRVLDFLEGRD